MTAINFGQAAKYPCELMRKPLSAFSSRPVRSADRLAWIALAQHLVFAVVGPSLWNDDQRSLSSRSKILIGVHAFHFLSLPQNVLFLWAVLLRALRISTSVKRRYINSKTRNNAIRLSLVICHSHCPLNPSDIFNYIIYSPVLSNFFDIASHG